MGFNSRGFYQGTQAGATISDSFERMTENLRLRSEREEARTVGIELDKQIAPLQAAVAVATENLMGLFQRRQAGEAITDEVMEAAARATMLAKTDASFKTKSIVDSAILKYADNKTLQNTLGGYAGALAVVGSTSYGWKGLNSRIGGFR